MGCSTVIHLLMTSASLGRQIIVLMLTWLITWCNGSVTLDRFGKNLQVYVTMPRLVISPFTFTGSGMFLIDSILLLDIFNPSLYSVCNQYNLLDPYQCYFLSTQLQVFCPHICNTSTKIVSCFFAVGA